MYRGQVRRASKGGACGEPAAARHCAHTPLLVADRSTDYHVSWLPCAVEQQHDARLRRQDHQAAKRQLPGRGGAVCERRVGEPGAASTCRLPLPQPCQLAARWARCLAGCHNGCSHPCPPIPARLQVGDVMACTVEQARSAAAEADTAAQMARVFEVSSSAPLHVSTCSSLQCAGWPPTHPLIAPLPLPHA